MSTHPYSEHLRQSRDGHGREWVSFHCPGCKRSHAICVESKSGVKGPVWSLEPGPTISPSVKVSDGDGTMCHLFVRGGKIKFLSDCRHELAGKTVPLEQK
ncbi:MAG: DUF6527 family protein [Phycisphaerales bacterium JB065]